jgi:hypothetical protein
LALSDRTAVDAVIAQALAVERNISEKEFRAFIQGRARAIQSIAAYLAAYVDFQDPNYIQRVDGLAANTLAYHLADGETRPKLLEVFRATAQSIQANVDVNLQGLIKRSPLPPADIHDLWKWLNSDLEQLRVAEVKGELLDLLVPKAMSYLSVKSISSISDHSQILPVLRAWIESVPYHSIQEVLAELGIKFGRRWVTVEHVVAMCEGGFAYDLAMVLASISDLLEELDEDLWEKVVTLQRQVKVGLKDEASITFFESGFADRVVASELGAAFPEAHSRSDVCKCCKSPSENFNRILEKYPAYFQLVAGELRAS